jgi:hypothetical protein
MREITKIKKLNEIAKRNERINGRRETKMEREKRKVSDYNKKNGCVIGRSHICNSLSRTLNVTKDYKF